MDLVGVKHDRLDGPLGACSAEFSLHAGGTEHGSSECVVYKLGALG